MFLTCFMFLIAVLIGAPLNLVVRIKDWRSYSLKISVLMISVSVVAFSFWVLGIVFLMGYRPIEALSEFRHIPYIVSGVMSGALSAPVFYIEQVADARKDALLRQLLRSSSLAKEYGLRPLSSQHPK